MKKRFFIKEENKIKVTSEDIDTALSKEISLTTHLNEKYSKQIESFGGELDGFDIALLSAGIYTKTDLTLGVESSNMMTFFTTDQNKMLFPEFVLRQLKQITGMPSIVNDLVGLVRFIPGDGMKQVYLDYSNSEEGKANKKGLKMRRIAEGAEVPFGKIKVGEVSIKIFKYGIGIEATYEALRRMSIDMFRKQMELVLLQAGYDQVQTIIETIVQGDGNKNAATVYSAKALNPDSVEGEIDEKTLISFLISQAPFNFDTILVDKDIYTQICTILMDKNLSNSINPQVNFKFPQGLLKDLKVIYSEDVGLTSDNKKQIIGLEQAYAIEKDIEANSTINEAAKVAKNQTQYVVITENVGFSKIDKRASAILKLA